MHVDKPINKSSNMSSISTLMFKQREHVARVCEAMDECERLLLDGTTHEATANAMRPLEDYVNFIDSFNCATLFESNFKAKESALRDLHLFLDNEKCPFPSFMSEPMRLRIILAIAVLENKKTQ